MNSITPIRMLNAPAIASQQAGVNGTVVNRTGTLTDKTESQTDQKDSLSSPAEVAGRSVVNFKGALSSADLNFIARGATLSKLNKEELKVAKQALKETMDLYKCSSARELSEKRNASTDAYLEVFQDFLSISGKIKPDINFDKLGKFFTYSM